jgi:hypothetical protein
MRIRSVEIVRIPTVISQILGCVVKLLWNHNLVRLAPFDQAFGAAPLRINAAAYADRALASAK